MPAAHGGRWAILRAMADFLGEDGRRGTKLMTNSRLLARGLALSHKEFLPWFEARNRDISEIPPGEVAEIHVDNAKTHLFSDDYNAMGSRNRKDELVARAKELYQPDVGICRGLLLSISGMRRSRMLRC